MSIRASQCPRQWWAPPPKPKWARRSTVMSNGSVPTASGSVLAGGLSRCSVVPAGISRPSTVMSSTAWRVVHTTVGFHRITSSTAFAASSGRAARSSH